MAEAGSKGLFHSILATLDLVGPEDNLALDAALMVGLADGGLSMEERDALERALADQTLKDTTWPQILDRAELLATEAPFFSESRARLARGRWTEEQVHDALRLAARVGTAGTPLIDEQRAFWSSLAKSLGVKEPQLQALLPKWGTSTAPASEVAMLRPAFSSPDQAEPINLFDALARAEGPQLRAMMFKLSAPRDLASLRLDDAQITEVGTVLELGDHSMRLDAVLEAPEAEWWVRCLSDGEALYPVERVLLPHLLTTLAPHQRFALVHEGDLSPADQLAIAELDADRFITQRL